MAEDYRIKYARLLKLVDVSEDMFFLPRGSLHEECRFAPLMQFRQLTMMVAREAGYTYRCIGDAMCRNEATVRTHIRRGKEKSYGTIWWKTAGAELKRRWDEVLAE